MIGIMPLIRRYPKRAQRGMMPTRRVLGLAMLRHIIQMHMVDIRPHPSRSAAPTRGDPRDGSGGCVAISASKEAMTATQPAEEEPPKTSIKTARKTTAKKEKKSAGSVAAKGRKRKQ